MALRRGLLKPKRVKVDGEHCPAKLGDMECLLPVGHERESQHRARLAGGGKVEWADETLWPRVERGGV